MSTAESSTSPTTLPRALQLVDGNVPSTPCSSTSSAVLSPTRTVYPQSAGLPTPPPSSRRPASANPRRQSSISYFPSDHVSIRSPTSPSFSTFRPSVKRSNSLGIRTAEGFAPLLREKGDRRSLGSENGRMAPLSPSAERGPLTLTEKHADLLQFIAQKESKCLELRSQLAVHEEELAHLKRKWERIVSRGMDRAYTAAFPSNSSTAATASSQHASSPSITAALLNPANGAVLDGLKEGVQGVGRLLAAGLDLSGPVTTHSSPATSVGPGLSGVSRAALAPALKRAKHGTTQSISSVSTAGTTSSGVLSAGTRLSQSSASSLSFAEDEEDRLLEQDEDKTIHQGDSSASSEIAISPSTATKSAKLLRRRSREAPKVPLDEHNSKASTPSRPGIKRSTTSATSPLSATPVSSWVGSMGNSVGKKWEELQKGETFTKSQKRASILISDVSQSIFAALSSPGTPSAQTSRSSGSSQLSVSTNANTFLSTASPVSASPSPVPSTGSLLEDDDDEFAQAGTNSRKALGDVLVPVSLSSQKKSSKPLPATTPSPDDDDEWNW
ncbi:hypothetical protein BXZ70DRAFT_895280 [Cristinia sonorae]|uniref:Uncharacterized protein n=1 Tax=Cristinia sonorae TaxID=1940300 RepID=A0A8K0UMY2_9AGAR|nr:hypothetical protein BXZ70DRAFT_895280 [Cristinia sonorae]